MARAFICDHCGSFVKGEPPSKTEDWVKVGASDAEIYLNVQVFQNPTEGKRFQPELCAGCHVTAVLAVAKDLEKGDDDGM